MTVSYNYPPKLVFSKIQITALVENYANQTEVIAEHGISLLIEIDSPKSGSKRILFDTGATGATLIKNLNTLGKSLFPLDAIITSHGHKDHTGGLRHVAQQLFQDGSPKNSVPVYYHPAAFKPKYAGKEKKRFIGFPFKKEEFDESPLYFKPVAEPITILPGVFLSGEIPRTHEFQAGVNLFAKSTDDQFIQDPLLDDIGLGLHLNQGIVIITGCGHSGIINILRAFATLTPDSPLYALIGGLHLRNLSSETLNSLISQISEYCPKIIAPCHCCDLKSRQELANAFSESYRLLSVGVTLELPSTRSVIDPLTH